MPKGVFTRTEKYINSLRVPHKKGSGIYTRTEEAKKNMSEIRKVRKIKLGYLNSPETRKKISDANKGKHPSEETKQKLSDAKKGVKNYLWKGGSSKTGYGSLEYKRWRIRVFERDNWTCQFCGIRGVYIMAHHIKSWAHYPNLRFDVTNGVTLCEDCHKLTDNYKGRNKKKKVNM